ncbi:MAG: hypothetical protein ACFFD1_13500 [Candidatus Thorarchaeota archaeon]
MDFISSLRENWTLIFTWMVFILIVVFYFEYRRWHYEWTFSEPTKYTPKQEYYFIYKDYLNWWNNLSSSPEKSIMSIHHNFINYLESEYSYLTPPGYARRGADRVTPYFKVIKDEELKKFLLEPVEWLMPYIKGKEHLFTSQDRDIYYYALTTLIDPLFDLHSRICRFTGNEIGDEWKNLFALENLYQKKLKQKRIVHLLKTIGLYLGILAVLIIGLYPFVTLDAPVYVLIVSILAFIVFMMSLTEAFHRLVINPIINLFKKNLDNKT